eukprot:796240-Pyramimonas_sp.AAC.1
MECDICHITQHFRRECPQGDGRGRGPSIHLVQTDSDIQHVDRESFLADPADGSATIVHFRAARYLSASVALENYAGELFEEVLAGHDDIEMAEWLGMPIAGPSADIEFVENFHMPIEGDFGMAGAPADLESTIPATDEEIYAMLYPRAIGHPTNVELID